MDLYLRIAPELFLKRCVVGGIERVFEINRNFRNEGADSTHNPEFTMLEAYEAYGDYDTMAALTQELIQAAAGPSLGSTVVAPRRRHGVRPRRGVGAGHVYARSPRRVGEEVTADTPIERAARACRRARRAVRPGWGRAGRRRRCSSSWSSDTLSLPTFVRDFPRRPRR